MIYAPVGVLHGHEHCHKYRHREEETHCFIWCGIVSAVLRSPQLSGCGWYMFIVNEGPFDTSDQKSRAGFRCMVTISTRPLRVKPQGRMTPQHLHTSSWMTGELLRTTLQPPPLPPCLPPLLNAPHPFLSSYTPNPRHKPLPVNLDIHFSLVALIRGGGRETNLPVWCQGVNHGQNWL